MESKEFIFEILVIDPSGKSEIQTPKSLLHGLLSNEKIWDEPIELKEDDLQCIQDGDLKLKIKPIDTSLVLYDLIESAFLIKVRSTDFDKIEKFRLPFVNHLKSRLRFDHIRILKDDISTEISNEIYPLINEIENLLRRYIAKFFIQKIGLDWWRKIIPDHVMDKARQRQDNDNVFSGTVETDLTLLDFDDLGEIIYKHKLGFGKQENVLDKVLALKTVDDLEKLKADLDSNYNRFFKTNFKSFGFDRKWKQLFVIRNKVAHNTLFVIQELNDAEALFSDLKEIITQAESKIDEFKFSLEEQVAIREAVTDQTDNENENDGLNETAGSLKIIGKIDLAAKYENESYDYKIISETELLKELQKAESTTKNLSSHFKYVGLKSFVTKLLGSKGYSIGPTYALVNILRDKEIVEIYDVEDELSYYPVKAIRKAKE